MIVRMFSGSLVAVLMAAALAVAPTTGIAAAASSATNNYRCGHWTVVKAGLAVSTQSCVKLEHRGSQALVRGLFRVRNRTEAGKRVSYFPQAYAHRGGGTQSAQMGGDSGRKRIPAHKTVTFSKHTTMLTGSKMWITVEYLLYQKKISTRLADTPHIKPYWR
jgi:hypothetical protein